MRCLEQSDQKGNPDRAQPGNLSEKLIGWMLVAFGQQLPPRFSTYPHQNVELLTPSVRSRRLKPTLKGAPFYNALTAWVVQNQAPQPSIVLARHSIVLARHWAANFAADRDFRQALY